MGFLRDDTGFTAAHDLNPAPVGGLPADILQRLQGINPEPTGAAPVPDNILASIAGLNAPQGAAPTGPETRKRKRASVIEILGTLADAGAEFGGAEAGYRQGIERQQQQARQEEADAWQQKFNQQKLQAGQFDLNSEQQKAAVTKYGQVARGLNALFQSGGAPAIAKAFPALAQQLGLSPEETEMFGQQLAADPQGTIEALTAATDPTAGGSQPKEIAIANMLRKQDALDGGTRANDYIDSLTNVGMTPYQEAQTRLAEARLAQNERLGRDRIGVQRLGITSRAQTAREATAAKTTAKAGSKAPDTSRLRSVISGLRTAYTNLANNGGATRAGGNIVDNLKARVQSSAAGQLVGSYAGTKNQAEFDKINTMRPAVLQAVMQATGMSAKQVDSNAEMKLQLAQATDPTMGYEANMASLDRLEEMVNEHNREKPTPAARSGGTVRRTLKPSGGKPAGRTAAKPSVSNW